MKGETTGSMTKSFATHAPELLDTILQGRLVYEGVVNKEWVEEQMTYIRHGKIDNLWPIIRILTAQRWLNMWEL